MSYKQPTFSVNSYDEDGDIIDKGIFLHHQDTSILIANTLEDFEKYIEWLQSIKEEILKNYGDLK